MNQKSNIDAGRNEQMLEEILQHAEPRPRPADAAAASAYEALHKEWRGVTRARSRQRRAAFLGVAASLVVAAVAGTQWFESVPAPAEFLQIDVLRASGSEVHHNEAQHSAAQLVSAGLNLQHGDELATSQGTRLALRWDSGSLRLNENTRVRFDNAETLSLLSGQLYFDSTPFDAGNTAPGRIAINTALGRVSHLGTQFQVGMLADELSVSVREGQVHIAGERIDVTLVKGEGMALATDGHFERHPVAGYDSAWQWAADIAPEQELGGHTTAEVLQWVARETGREVRFRTEAARAMANSEPRGISSLAPLSALRTIPFMTSLQYSLSDGYIIVDIADSQDR
ncbi:MAG: FecR family protein [Woeseia sp.]